MITDLIPIRIRSKKLVLIPPLTLEIRVESLIMDETLNRETTCIL